MQVSYDLHIHSCLSPCGDNDMTPNNIVNMAMLLGLDVIAVSDHNSAKNLPAVISVANSLGITVVPAIEVCTMEEVHMLCLLPTLENAVTLGDEIYPLLPSFKNDVEAFGDQLITDENDEVIGYEEKLLINAIDLSIDKLLPIVASLGGIAIPAHVDKSANSIISNLGLIPPEYDFSCIEIKNPENKIDFNGNKITNSDAHQLELIHEPTYYIDVNEKSAIGIINSLKQKR